jgi:hypothetical protein
LFRCTHHLPVAEFSFNDRRRVFLQQALGADEFLRVTWHETDRVIVFSHWQSEICVAATPVKVADTAELTTLLVQALGHAATQPAAGSETISTQGTTWQRLVTAMRRLTGHHLDQFGLIRPHDREQKSA